MSREPARSVDHGGWLLVAASAVGLASAGLAYIRPGSGISRSGGALLVVGSTALLLAAALVTTLDRHKAAWLRVFLRVAIPLGLLGTGLAAFFLESHALLALMGLGLIGWLLHLVRGPRHPAPAARRAGPEALP